MIQDAADQAFKNAAPLPPPPLYVPRNACAKAVAAKAIPEGSRSQDPQGAKASHNNNAINSIGTNVKAAAAHANPGHRIDPGLTITIRGHVMTKLLTFKTTRHSSSSF